jgi:hypothetical protein
MSVTRLGEAGWVIRAVESACNFNCLRVSAIASERSQGRPSQLADFQADARKIVDPLSAERFEAALKALLSPERNFRPPLRRTSRSKSPMPPPDQPNNR